jgi:predicted nucleic acid-binding protein
MVGSKVLFDTNILIDYLSGVVMAQTEIDSCLDRAVSVVTWMEVMAGATATDEPRIRAFLATFRNLPLTSEIAEQSVTIRRQRKMKLPDAIIKTTAEVTGRLLISRNTRDFPAGDPGVRIPYRI